MSSTTAPTTADEKDGDTHMEKQANAADGDAAVSLPSPSGSFMIGNSATSLASSSDSSLRKKMAGLRIDAFMTGEKEEIAAARREIAALKDEIAALKDKNAEAERGIMEMERKFEAAEREAREAREAGEKETANYFFDKATALGGRIREREGQIREREGQIRERAGQIREREGQIRAIEEQLTIYLRNAQVLSTPSAQHSGPASRGSSSPLVLKGNGGPITWWNAMKNKSVFPEYVPMQLLQACDSMDRTTVDTVAESIKTALKGNKRENDAAQPVFSALKKATAAGTLHDTHKSLVFRQLGQRVDNNNEKKRPDALRTAWEVNVDLDKLGEFVAVTTFEWKGPAHTIAKEDYEKKNAATDTHAAIGQAMMYGTCMLNAQPWRSEAINIVTNFRQAVVVRTVRKPYDAKYRQCEYEFYVSFLLDGPIRGDATAADADEGLRQLASLLVTFALCEAPILGWVPPHIKIGTDTTIGITFTRWLGEGGTSTVLEATDTSDPENKYAVKVRVILDQNGPTVEDFAAEQDLLQHLWSEHQDDTAFDFPQFVGCLDGCKGAAFAVAPVCEKGASGLNKANVKAIVSSIKWLHGLGYVHLDLRTANILQRADGTALISDLGFAKKVSVVIDDFDVRTFAGARHYTPGPSSLAFKNGKVDLFALDLQLFVRVCFKMVYNSKIAKKAYAECDWSCVEEHKTWNEKWKRTDEAAKEREYEKLSESLNHLLR